MKVTGFGSSRRAEAYICGRREKEDGRVEETRVLEDKLVTRNGRRFLGFASIHGLLLLGVFLWGG